MTVTAPRLPNGQPIQERIGVYGLPKIGKTHLYFNIARWHQELGSDAKFYALNNDTSFPVLWMNEEFQGLENIEWQDVNYLQDYINWARHYHSIMRPQDWLCVDLLDGAWAAAQDEYARALAKEKGENFEDIGDLWMFGGLTTTTAQGGQKTTEAKYPIGGWDWGYPNGRYRVLANNYILRGPGHRFLISGQQELQKPTPAMESKEKDIDRKRRKMFEHLGGLAPAGQKEDAFRWHTVLHVDVAERDEEGKPSRQKFSTAGERYGYRRWLGQKMSNGQVRDEVLDDFFMDYLVKVGGWET